MKHYLRIGPIDDCLNLNFDLDRFVDYFRALGLNLNLFKCKVVIFIRSHSPIIHS